MSKENSVSTRCALAFVLCVIGASMPASSQQILIDQGVRAGELWVFPSVLDENHWFYVPSTARLVVDDEGAPKFSLVRYVTNTRGDADGSAGITQAEGGGILHFLVVYDTSAQQIRDARRALEKRDPENEEIELRGPVIFKEGRYVLVSSIIAPGGDNERQLLASGNAPVLEGSQIALSFELPPDRATLLMRSFEMATPDVSLVFEMVIEGITDSFEAELIIRWDDVLNHQSFAAGGDVAFKYFGIGGEVEAVMAELQESKSVELRTKGANPNMEALIERVQSQLLELMFERIPVDEAPESADGGGGGLGSLLDQFGGGGSTGSTRPSTIFGLSAGYRARSVRRTGESIVNLNHQSSVSRVTTIGFNVGDLWSRYSDDERFVRTINTQDAAFQQREIHLSIDGAILPEFDKYINSVTTVLKKTHQGGDSTIREIVIDRETFNREQNDFRMIYGWKDDADRDEWLEYEYRTRWSFKGGGALETNWQRSDANMIDLFAPYKRKVVRIFGDHTALADADVRAVIVEVEYGFFDDRKRSRVRLRTNAPMDGGQIELTLPLGENSYDYRITWIRGRGDKLVQEGTDDTGILFVDELPEAPSATS